MLAEDLDEFFWEDRAAHLASCQLPLIVALAGKNNIVSCKAYYLSTLYCTNSSLLVFTGVGHEKVSKYRCDLVAIDTNEIL